MIENLVNGENPFTHFSPFLDHHFFYAYTNCHGELWVAYINNTTFEITFSGQEIGWEWQKEENHKLVLSTDEKVWLSLVQTQAIHLKNRKRATGPLKPLKPMDLPNA